jgi:hypothetical protein
MESIVKMPNQKEKMNPEDNIYLCQKGVWYKVVVTPLGEFKKRLISLEDVPLKYRNPTPSV